MKDIEIKISKENRKIIELSNYEIGNDGENLQGNLIFSFFDEFVDGQARLLYENYKGSFYIPLIKIDNTYTTPIKSVITKQGKISLQLVITEGTNEDEIPIFKSDIFSLKVGASINDEIEQPDEYPQWIDVANTKLNEFEKIDIDIVKVDNITTVTKTNKDGTVKSVEIHDGEKGEKGDCNFATFDIENGSLIMNKTEDMLLEFKLNEKGMLEVIV